MAAGRRRIGRGLQRGAPQLLEGHSLPSESRGGLLVTGPRDANQDMLGLDDTRLHLGPAPNERVPLCSHQEGAA